MKSCRIKVTRILPVLAIAGLALSLPLTSQAASSNNKVGAPIVVTGGAGQARGTSATLDGTVDPAGAVTSYYFQYGPTVAYGSQTPTASLAPGFTKAKVAVTATHLLPGYHYRIVASNANGTSHGRDRIFTNKKLSKPKFEIAKPTAPSVFGDPFIISGTLTGTGNAGRQVVVQASPFPYLEPFSNAGLPITTNLTGRFSFRVASLTTSTQFRVGTVGSAPMYSSVITDQVAVHVTLKVRSGSRKGLVRLYGTVTPAEVGAQVFFQLRKAVRPKGKSENTTRFATHFSTVVKRGTKTVSRFSDVVEVGTGGSYRAYVQVRKKGPLVSGSSQTVALSAAPTTKGKGKAKPKTH